MPAPTKATAAFLGFAALLVALASAQSDMDMFDTGNTPAELALADYYDTIRAEPATTPAMNAMKFRQQLTPQMLNPAAIDENVLPQTGSPQLQQDVAPPPQQPAPVPTPAPAAEESSSEETIPDPCEALCAAPGAWRSQDCHECIFRGLLNGYVFSQDAKDHKGFEYSMFARSLCVEYEKKHASDPARVRFPTCYFQHIANACAVEAPHKHAEKAKPKPKPVHKPKHQAPKKKAPTVQLFHI